MGMTCDFRVRHFSQGTTYVSVWPASLECIVKRS